MKLRKTYQDDSRGLIECNDTLDELNESMSEHERSQHDARECLDGCLHCEAQVQADLKQQHQDDIKARRVFNWFQDVLAKEFKRP